MRSDWKKKFFGFLSNATHAEYIHTFLKSGLTAIGSQLPSLAQIVVMIMSMIFQGLLQKKWTTLSVIATLRIMTLTIVCQSSLATKVHNNTPNLLNYWYARASKLYQNLSGGLVQGYNLYILMSVELESTISVSARWMATKSFFSIFFGCASCYVLNLLNEEAGV